MNQKTHQTAPGEPGLMPVGASLEPGPEPEMPTPAPAEPGANVRDYQGSPLAREVRDAPELLQGPGANVTDRQGSPLGAEVTTRPLSGAPGAPGPMPGAGGAERSAEAPAAETGGEVRGQEMADGSIVWAALQKVKDRSSLKDKPRDPKPSGNPPDILGDLTIAILQGVEKLLAVSQHQGPGPPPVGQPFHQVPWADRPWPAFEASEDYAAASPGVNVTSQTGTRGAGGWGFGSRNFGNGMSDRMEPARRFPGR